MTKIISIILTLCLLFSFGCGAKNDKKESLSYETNVIDVQSKYQSCGNFEKIIPELIFEDEEYIDPIQANKVATRNIIYIGNKLNEAAIIIQCYEKQTKKINGE